MKANVFFDKLFTKSWVKANTSFRVPKTLGVVRLQDFERVLEHVELPQRFVVKPVHGRMSRSVALVRRSIDSETFLVGPGKKVLAHNFAKIVASTAKLGHVPTLFFIEEMINNHSAFDWAIVGEPWGPPVVRFVVHDKKVTCAVVLCAMQEADGLAGAGSRPNFTFAYLSPKGRPLSAEEVAAAQGNRLTKKDELYLSARTLNREPKPFEEVSHVTELIENEIAPCVQPFSKNGIKRPFSVDGVFNPMRQFVLIEINHKPGQRLKVPVE